MTARRAIRRALRRAAALGPLEPLAWRVRAYRRERARRLDTRPKPQLYNRLARIATPPEIRALDEELRAIASSGEPVIFAEWTGDVEIELLYWIPFLTWLVEGLGIPRDRCTAVTSRATWYANVAAKCASAPVTPTVMPASLTTLCSSYWNDAGPIVTVLDRLSFKRLPVSSERTGPCVVRDSFTSDLDAFTRDVSQSTVLVGPANGPIHLGPLCGTPTLAIDDRSPSPHLDIAQRAAHGYRTPFALVAPASLELTIDLVGS